MAEPTGSSADLAERPKDAAASEEGEKGPSKNALKKAAKDKEKVGLLKCFIDNKLDVAY